MDAATSSSTSIATAKPPFFPGRYYTWLVLTVIFSVLAFLVLEGVLDLISWLHGSSGNYHVAGSPFHITSNWSWSVKAGFWLVGALMVEMKCAALLAVAAPLGLFLWGCIRRAGALLTRH